MSAPRVSHYKIVISGHIVEAFQYAKPVGFNLASSKKQAPHRKRRALADQEITASSISRTKNRLIRLINANSRTWLDDGKPIEPQFLTYTFAENLTDLTVANHYFTNYIKRLNYHAFGVKESVARYVVVPEFQKRGAVHYHAVFFNLPAINARHEFKTGEFQKKWKYGHIKSKKIKHISNVGLYMTKYMTKDAQDKRLVGRKKYFSSRYLRKPEVVSYEHVAGQMMDYLTEVQPLHAYITKKNDNNPHTPENPTFCATYNLSPEQLSQLRSFYSLSAC